MKACELCDDTGEVVTSKTNGVPNKAICGFCDRGKSAMLEAAEMAYFHAKCSHDILLGAEVDSADALESARLALVEISRFRDSLLPDPLFLRVRDICQKAVDLLGRKIENYQSAEPNAIAQFALNRQRRSQGRES